MPIIKIVDLATGEEIEREMTPEEKVQWDIDKKNVKLEIEAKNEILVKKEALLEKLGITADEAKLLLS